jgi:hypothetical protein
MTVELIGGPLDGAIKEAPSHLPTYMVALNMPEKPIYKRACCLTHQDIVHYVFIGYETCSTSCTEKHS